MAVHMMHVVSVGTLRSYLHSFPWHLQVLHDGDLARVAGTAHSRPISQLTAAEASTIDVGSWMHERFKTERIPLLSDVLTMYAGALVHLHVELKSQQEGLPAAVAAAVKQEAAWLRSLTLHAPADTTNAFRVPGLTITSFHLPQLLRSLKELPGVRHGWLVQEITLQVLEAATGAGVHGLYPRANASTAEGTSAARDAGLSVRAWGVRDIQLMRHVRACGAQGCTVNWPDEARAALEQEMTSMDGLSS
mmetsp:Transcript_212/g.625  ORF Transcript_212/g.625 Transcript_212/m.625 type:complete len:248 (-) Transcript_212:58-801(-)